MRRLLPFPIVSAAVLVLWLLLNQTLSPGHILLGSIAALLGGRVLAALEPPRTRVRRLGAICRLAGLVVVDILRSNIAVARIILGSGQTVSGFMEIPLELRDRYGLATLALILTSTPGTLWVDFDTTSGTLTIHVLDLVDKSEWIDKIKWRYERLLLEIFA